LGVPPGSKFSGKISTQAVCPAILRAPKRDPRKIPRIAVKRCAEIETAKENPKRLTGRQNGRVQNEAAMIRSGARRAIAR